MRLGGLLKFSLIDYPGKAAAVIFTQGCNFRCPFCHNPELVLPDLFTEPISVEEVFGFLKKRCGQLGGVVVTGGEPTVQDELLPFLQRIKALGYAVKLDTNGSFPDKLQKILAARCVDTVAMDIKTVPEFYSEASGVVSNTEAVRASMAIIRSSGISYEFRTTALKCFLPVDKVADLLSLMDQDAVYNIRRCNLKGKILAPQVFSGFEDYSEAEWSDIVRVAAEGRIRR